MSYEKQYYFIEGVAKDDWIGIDTYIDSLESAIDNKAKFIGLISDYGTGKSTIINKLDEREQLKNNKLIYINLWNCSNDRQNDTIDIHRIFLHQLIDKLDLKNRNYYKKKINKNYNLFDIKLKTENSLYIIFLLTMYVMLFFEKIGFIELFTFGHQIVIYLLTALLTVLCTFIYKPVIAFKKSDSNTREIDENDTKDLYNEIIKEYFKKHTNQKLIICLEELDRYDNPEALLEYLKEFYKYYNESNYKEKICFIVSIKSAYQLNGYNQDNNINEIKNIYEKVFDYILNLNQINIHDYDSIIWSMIKEKRNNMPSGILIPNENNLNNWRYLYKGNDIKIRDIKHRYNFAISLYLSVEESGITPDFDKCLFIAYLEDEYNDLYEQLIKENLINDILINHANGVASIQVLKQLGIKEEHLNVLIEGLDLKYISIDYNYYFYKFPKDKKSYNIYEYELYYSIFYDEDRKYLPLALYNLTDEQIVNIITKRVTSQFLPKIIFKYQRLLTLTYENEPDAFNNTLTIKFDLLKNFDQFIDLINKLKVLSKKTYNKHINTYFKYYLPKIKEYENDYKYEIRRNIVKELKNDSIIIKDLFYNENYIISSDEINCIDSFKIIKELTNFEKIDEQYIKALSSKLKTQAISKRDILDLLKELSKNTNVTNEIYNNFVYSIKLNEYKFTENEYMELFRICKEKMELNKIDNYSKYLNYFNFYCEKLDSYYLELLNESNEEENFKRYRTFINKTEKVYNKSIIYIVNQKGFYIFKKKIREEIYKLGYYRYYVISTLFDEKTYEIEKDKHDKLSKTYMQVFELTTNWTYKVGENMKMFLYENVNMSNLEEKQLSIFNDLSQRKDIIESVLETNNKTFINKYLKNISKIKQSDIEEVFNLLGEYNRKEKIPTKVKENLKNKTRSVKLKKLLDGRTKQPQK